MEYSFEHRAFPDRRLAVRSATLLKGAKLLVDGREAEGKGRKFTVRDPQGSEHTITLKGSPFDPIPKVQVDEEPPIELVPALRWYEYLWMGLPLVLIFGGGAIGGACGFVAFYASAHVFRSERGTVAKYALSGVISAVSVVLFLVLATALHLAVASSPG